MLIRCEEPMCIPWSKLILKTAIWLGAELALTCLGLDDLADYSEFVFQYHIGSNLLTGAIEVVIAV